MRQLVSDFSDQLGAVSQIRGTPLGNPHNKGYSISGSILGSPYFGKLPCSVFQN